MTYCWVQRTYNEDDFSGYPVMDFRYLRKKVGVANKLINEEREITFIFKNYKKIEIEIDLMRCLELID